MFSFLWKFVDVKIHINLKKLKTNHINHKLFKTNHINHKILKTNQTI